MFNSQPCESIFRDARSLSGTFSTRVNFTVKAFMQRSRKLSILNQIKYNPAEKDLFFPVHHKQKREHSLSSSYKLDDIDSLNVEQLIANTYNEAIDIVKHSKILDELNRCDINSMDNLSKYVFSMMNKTSRMINYSSPAESNIDDEFGLDEDNEDNTEESDEVDRSSNDIPLDTQAISDSDDEEDVINSMKSDFTGIRIADDINPALRQSYFKVKLNERIRYLHKQSACWLLQSDVPKLSCDRSSRVQQQATDNF